MTAQAREGEIEVDGARLPVFAVGPSDAGEAVVLIHGSPGSALDWQGVLTELAGGCRAVALTVPGIGPTAAPGRIRAGPAGYSRFLALALGALGVHRAHLVMHGVGTAVGLAWAARHGPAFRTAVLVSPGVLAARLRTVSGAPRHLLVGQVGAMLLTERGFRRRMTRGGDRPLPHGFLDRLWSGYDHRTRRAVLALHRATRPDDLRQTAVALRGLNRPALVVVGGRDPTTGPADADRMRGFFPDATVVSLPTSGHWPHVDDPGRVAALIRRATNRGEERHPAWDHTDIVLADTILEDR